jgi:tripartite-type tricarboxylate transporter receptor subunit TctC
MTLDTMAPPISRRRFGATLAGAAVLAAAPGAARAQAGFPNRPVKVIVPYPAGGIVDVVTRAATERMSLQMPQRVLVEARPGADGRIGLEAAARATPDGYTLASATPIVVVHEWLQPDPGFRLRDFVGIGSIGAPPSVFVVPASSPVTTLAEFIDYAKARPGQLNCPNPGSGSSVHLGQELLFDQAGLKLTVVGYKGQPPSIVDLIQGQMHFALYSLSLILPHIKAGKVRALAVNAGTRTRSLPAVPTIIEAGFPEALVQTWHGLMAPARTPRPVVEYLGAELGRAMAHPEVRATLEGLDAEIFSHDPEQFDALLRRESERWGRLIRERGIKAT